MKKQIVLYVDTMLENQMSSDEKILSGYYF